jgi:hypothetical protein
VSPLSWPVLAGAALIGSPALWAAYVSGTLSPDVAALRLAVCVLITWAGLSVLAALTREEPADQEMQRPADVDLE